MNRLLCLAAIALMACSANCVWAGGTVIAWGYDRLVRRNVPAGLSNVVEIAGGDENSVALQSNGTVIVWGNIASAGTLNNPVAIAARGQFGLALQTDGTVAAWGYYC